MKAIFRIEKIFRFNSRLPESYASTIAEMPNGDLLTAWFGGSKEGANDIAIYSSRLSKEIGEWTEPKLIADTEGTSDQNPVLFVDKNGAVWLFYVAFEKTHVFEMTSHTSVIMYKKVT